jgi:hypothetical protein
MPIGPNGEPLPYPEDMMGVAAGPPQGNTMAGPDVLKSMLELASQYAEVEQDEEDLLAIEQARTLIQKLLAKQQREQDDAMQGKMSAGFLRRG